MNNQSVVVVFQGPGLLWQTQTTYTICGNAFVTFGLSCGGNGQWTLSSTGCIVGTANPDQIQCQPVFQLVWHANHISNCCIGSVTITATAA